MNKSLKRKKMLLLFLFVGICCGASCLEDRYGSSLTCASNAVDQDIFVSDMFCPPLPVPMNCTIGEIIELPLFANIQANAATKYDISINIAADGGNALNGQCDVVLFTPITSNPSLLNVTGGSGPFWDADTDSCGDIRASDGVNTISLGYVNVTCQQFNGAGHLAVNTCVSWRNSAGVVCTGVGTAVPGSPALCVCEEFEIADVDVFFPPTPTPTVSPTSTPTKTPTVSPTSTPTKTPTSMAPTSMAPTSMAPTSMAPTMMTNTPTSISPTSMSPTSISPTSMSPTSISPTSMSPTSTSPTPGPTLEPTASPLTLSPTEGVVTDEPTSAPSSVAPTTQVPTLAPTSLAPTTQVPTLAPSSVAPTTQVPTLVPSSSSFTLWWLIPFGVLIVVLLLWCFTSPSCEFDPDKGEYRWRTKSNSGVYVETNSGGDLVITKKPYSIILSDNSIQTDSERLYAQKDGTIVILVCNHVRTMDPFLYYVGIQRDPFYDGLLVIKNVIEPIRIVDSQGRILVVAYPFKETPERDYPFRINLEKRFDVNSKFN